MSRSLREPPAPRPEHARLPASAAAIQVLLCALWAIGQIVIKWVSPDISPNWHAGLRSAGAALVLCLWIWWRRLPVFRRDGTGLLGLVIGVLFGVEFIFLFTGVQYTTAARATLMIYTASFFVALGAHFFVANDRLTVRKLLGLALAFAGVAIALGEKLWQPTPTSTAILKGDLMCLAAAFFWGATTVVVKATRLRSLLPEKNLLYQLGVSAIVLLLASWLLGEPGIIQPGPRLWAALAYGILVLASASYLAWFWMVAHYRATTLHAFTFLTPLFALAFSAGLLHEPISAGLLFAAALVAAGIVLVNRA